MVRYGTPVKKGIIEAPVWATKDSDVINRVKGSHDIIMKIYVLGVYTGKSGEIRAERTLSDMTIALFQHTLICIVIS